MDKILNWLFNKPGKIKLFLITKVFNCFIPFNGPHKFCFMEVADEKMSIRIPYRRVNKNHLGGVHACAIATAGEYAAGILLLKNFGMKEYRYILSELEVKYHYQGRMPVIASCHFSTTEKQKILQILKTDKTNIRMQTELHDLKNNHVATVMTNWQIKSWSQVKTK
ncbi:MAG: DUF4442 domain-containing protein [Bacteriovoracaceae bacterium]|nr:DUF4442 domain-containing protein [Bacteriovoracaceae bacterium]